jgi:hypothetical protein
MTLQSHLNSFCEAFNRRALDATVSLFSERAVFETPLLGQRLFGTREIKVGLRRIFDVSESAKMHLLSTKESHHVVIGEGELIAKLHRDSSPVRMPMAVSLEAVDGKISRLSTYFDMRPYRLWTDGVIYAPPHSTAN